MVRLILVAALIFGADGFAVNQPAATSRTVMSMTSDGESSASSRRDFAARAFGLTAAVLAGNASPAFAEAIKTFDMSMPSYDKASNPKAGVNAVAGKEDTLGISTSAGSGGGSMGYSGGEGSRKEKARKEAKSKEDTQKAEEKKAEKLTIVDMGMPSYASSTKSELKSSLAPFKL